MTIQTSILDTFLSFTPQTSEFDLNKGLPFLAGKLNSLFDVAGLVALDLHCNLKQFYRGVSLIIIY